MTKNAHSILKFNSHDIFFIIKQISKIYTEPFELVCISHRALAWHYMRSSAHYEWSFMTCSLGAQRLCLYCSKCLDHTVVQTSSVELVCYVCGAMKTSSLCLSGS